MDKYDESAGTGVSFEILAKISDLQAKKEIAVAAEDYDLAKRLKNQIQVQQALLDKGPPPPPAPPEPPADQLRLRMPKKPKADLTDEEKHEQRVAAFRQGITTSRDKDHGGDTHAMFAHLDDDESGHLSDEEMYTILGAPRGEEKKDAGPQTPRPRPPPPLPPSPAQPGTQVSFNSIFRAALLAAAP